MNTLVVGEYPWYGIVDGDDIEQGDILENCPVFLPPDDLDLASSETPTFPWEDRDVIVMSQSCDHGCHTSYRVC